MGSDNGGCVVVYVLPGGMLSKWLVNLIPGDCFLSMR